MLRAPAFVRQGFRVAFPKMQQEQRGHALRLRGGGGSIPGMQISSKERSLNAHSERAISAVLVVLSPVVYLCDGGCCGPRFRIGKVDELSRIYGAWRIMPVLVHPGSFSVPT